MRSASQLQVEDRSQAGAFVRQQQRPQILPFLDREQLLPPGVQGMGSGFR